MFSLSFVLLISYYLYLQLTRELKRPAANCKKKGVNITMKMSVTENQFGFMPGRSIVETIFLIRQLMEKYREKKKDLHMVFIDLEKAYNKVPRNVMWWALQKHKVSTKYITLIKDMYDNVVTSVRTSDGDTQPLSICFDDG
jgi:hypothetical protein